MGFNFRPINLLVHAVDLVDEGEAEFCTGLISRVRGEDLVMDEALRLSDLEEDLEEARRGGKKASDRAWSRRGAVDICEDRMVAAFRATFPDDADGDEVDAEWLIFGARHFQELVQDRFGELLFISFVQAVLIEEEERGSVRFDGIDEVIEIDIFIFSSEEGFKSGGVCAVFSFGTAVGEIGQGHTCF